MIFNRIKSKFRKRDKPNSLSIDNYREHSYSQVGEDMVIKFLLYMLKLNSGTYVDVGAFHPLKFSNTMYLYEKGWRGLNIEANPYLIDLFHKHRPDDINLNIGVLDVRGSLDFYVMSSATMSTFSKEEAENLVEQHGFSIKEIVQIPVLPIMDIIETYSKNQLPNILFVDVEGVDLKVIKSIDFSVWKPSVICCETVPYSTSGIVEKDHALIEYLQSKGYIIFADTFINTIFVFAEDLKNREVQDRR